MGQIICIQIVQYDNDYVNYMFGKVLMTRLNAFRATDAELKRVSLRCYLTLFLAFHPAPQMLLIRLRAFAHFEQCSNGCEMTTAPFPFSFCMVTCELALFFLFSSPNEVELYIREGANSK